MKNHLISRLFYSLKDEKYEEWNVSVLVSQSNLALWNGYLKEMVLCVEMLRHDNGRSLVIISQG